jgi:RND family efflux transporter MFP subunit
MSTGPLSNHLKHPNRWLLVAWTLPLAVLVTACSSQSDGAEKSQSTTTPTTPEVEVAIVEQSNLSEPVQGQGTIAAFQRSNIGALVQGPVDRIFVRVGDRVARGAPLFRIRQADYQRKVNEALAAVRLARAEAEQAERTNERVQTLKPRGFVSLSRAEQAETDVAVARARVSQAEAMAATAQQALNDTIVRAPYAAVVTSRNVDEGVYLSTFGVGGQSSVLELQEVGIVVAVVSLPQDRLGQIRKGQPARLFIEGFAQPLESQVAIINDKVDAQARTVEVRLPLRNPSYEVKPGLSVRAEIATPPRSALVLPRRAIAGDSAAPFAFVITNGTIRKIAVRIRSVDFDRVEIQSGLQAGQRIVLNPASTLRDGMKVRESKVVLTSSRTRNVAR